MSNSVTVQQSSSGSWIVSIDEDGAKQIVELYMEAHAQSLAAGQRIRLERSEGAVQSQPQVDVTSSS